MGQNELFRSVASMKLIYLKKFLNQHKKSYTMIIVVWQNEELVIK